MEVLRTMQWIGLAAIAFLVVVPAVEAHPIESSTCDHSYKFWITAWAKDPIDETGHGLHVFNSVGCLTNLYQ